MPQSEQARLSLLSPTAGTVVDLKHVRDDVFASKKMGEGFAVTDTPGGAVVAPVAGTVIMVAKTKHAVGIETADGTQVLVHLGIDTVELDGAPFTLDVQRGDTVSAGQQIATMDTTTIAKAGKDATIVVVISNYAKTMSGISLVDGHVRAGEVAAEATPNLAGVVASRSEKTELTGFDALAADIIRLVGGKENVRSLTHCITRERFYLHDESKADDAAISELDGVLQVMRAGGQYQVVIGPDVEDVYDALIAQLGEQAAGGEVAADASAQKERPTSALGWAKHGFSELIGVITGSMIPVIGLLAAAGIIKGILSLLTTFEVITGDSQTYEIINAMSDAVFYFLPIFVGFTAARRLGADPVIVAIIGGVLTYPSILEMSEGEGARSIAGMSLNADFFGLPFHMASYSYSIFPIIVAAWLASRIEPWLKKVIPNMVRMIFVPLIEVVVVSLAILLVLGPVITFISTGIANGIQSVYDFSPTISGLIIGGFYQCLVIFGLHWAVIPLVAQDIAATGNSSLNAIISATMVAQGGAVLAVFVKTRREKIKGLSGPAAIAAFCGITEPAMYGVNLKYGRVFAMASIGGAAGGLLTGLFNVNMWGFTGSLIGFSSFINPEGLDFSFWGFLIASATALVVAFVLTYLFGFKDSDVDSGREVKKVRLGNREPVQR
ncbi:glucose PTS transporter subunit IIA [Corynebacterium tapiri]|uniref:PTS beta-glucoside transporter subunit IIABC n=1 Tax=Corynebacterium tapiri TaxID=1448266 RepID=A0A5C4U450_9CORY|nr:glucose PTS transporter subunit IIA [Corynebacterium tapiri]TNL97262.1 PTS beta-glucoside transporter subunit IIABC [Corynebacterium tapiri]